MTRGRNLIAFAFLLLVPLAASARTFDPFLESLRVGQVRGEDTIPMDGPWPRDLFLPLIVDEQWLASHDAPDEHGAFAAVAPSALGSDAAAELHRLALLQSRRAASARQAETVLAGRTAATAERCREILAEERLDPEAVLVWSLRRRAAADPEGRSCRSDDALWPELLQLDSYDIQAGWDLWSAHRRALALPLLPDRPLSEDETRWLMRLRTSRLAPRDIDRARVPSPRRAALGAASLGRDQLVRHFGLYPEPPGDASLASAWARGHWKRNGHTVQAAEHLGSLASLPWTVRADYWRRAADKHISAGRWVEGRQALGEAVELARRAGRRFTSRRVGEECGRAAALARHLGRIGDAAAFAALADELDPPTGNDDGDTARREMVLAGDAPDIALEHTYDFARIVADVEQRVWAEWRQVGLALASRSDNGPITERYREELEEDRFGPAVGVMLAAHSLRDEALAWALTLDLEEGDGPVAESPVPAWSRQLGSGPGDQLVRHALYGLCLLGGDTRGRLACAVSLSRPGLDEQGHRLFLYPFPGRSAIVEAVQDAPDPALVLAVARNESLFDPGVRSRAGALGWMQVMPFHFDGQGVVDGRTVWRIPARSVGKGLALLEENRRRYGGDPYRALAAYNAGPGAVSRWDRQMGGNASRADFLGWIGYPETRRYVEKVLIDRQIYAEVLRNFSGEDGTRR